MKYSLSFAGTLAIGMIISFQYIDVTNGFPFEILLVALVSFAVPCVLVMRDIKKDEKKNISSHLYDDRNRHADGLRRRKHRGYTDDSGSRGRR